MKLEKSSKKVKQSYNNESIYDKNLFIWKQILEYNKTITMALLWKYGWFLNGKTDSGYVLKKGDLGWKECRKSWFFKNENCLSNSIFSLSICRTT